MLIEPSAVACPMIHVLTLMQLLEDLSTFVRPQPVVRRPGGSAVVPASIESGLDRRGAFVRAASRVLSPVAARSRSHTDPGRLRLLFRVS